MNKINEKSNIKAVLTIAAATLLGTSSLAHAESNAFETEPD